MQTNTTFQNNVYCSYSDRGLLHGLSKGIISESKLEALVAKQKQDLNHALTCETHTHTHTNLLPVSVTLSSLKLPLSKNEKTICGSVHLFRPLY